MTLLFASPSHVEGGKPLTTLVQCCCLLQKLSPNEASLRAMDKIGYRYPRGAARHAMIDGMQNRGDLVLMALVRAARLLFPLLTLALGSQHVRTRLNSLLQLSTWLAPLAVSRARRRVVLRHSRASRPAGANRESPLTHCPEFRKPSAQIRAFALAF
eukprot:6191259-Pleurochrysis_carterae.AAC.4